MSINPSKANSGTTETFVTSLVTNTALLGIQVGVFLFLKKRFGRVYSPRTYLPPPDKRAEPLPQGAWRWVPAVLLSNPMEIIYKNGLDAYMHLRFIRMLMIIFFVFTLITWPILLPLTAANVPDSRRDGLDKLSWGNIQGSAENRYAGHIVIAYLLTFFVIWMARREMSNFVHMRHQFLLSKGHSKHAQARTVLITALPNDLATDHDLREFASFVPGGIERTWVYRDTKDLNERFEERQKACAKLESAVAVLLRKATLAWHTRQSGHKKEVKRLESARKKEVKLAEKQKQTGKMADIDPERVVTGPEPLGVGTATLVPEKATPAFLDELVPDAQRPTHRLSRLGFLGLGQKVDTINHYKAEVARLNAEIEENRKHIDKREPLGSAFVECNFQLGAHVLAQCVSYHEPLAMTDKWIEVHPRDVIWANLDDSAYEMRTRYVTSWITTIALIVLWAFPTAFAGSLSNLDDLCSQFSWLRWVCKAPKPLPGLLQGVLPPLLLALLMIFLPILLRALAWYEGIPLYSLLSVSVYKRYYAFLVLNGFLVVTLSSAITATIYDILQRPAQAVESLAARLPDASIFFLTYMATQGLAGAASALVQLARLVVWFIQKWFLGRTPRQAYNVTFVMPAADFGVVLPRMSLLATIGFAYSVLSPIINGLATLSFFLFFLAWKFLLTQVYDQPDEMETGGLYFPLAISNLFIGLYIEQICLSCLFALKIPQSPKTFIPQTAVMVVLMVITFFAQLSLNHSFAPITQYIPMSLATKKMSERYKKNKPKPLVDAVAEVAEKVGADEDVVDLFNRDKMRSVLRRRLKLDPVKKDKKKKKEKHADEERPKPVETAPAQGATSATQLIGTQPAVTNGNAVAGPSSTAPPGPLAQSDPHVLKRSASLESVQSNASSVSSHSGKSVDQEAGKQAAIAEEKAQEREKEENAVLPKIAPPAEALRGDDEDDDADEYFDEHAFDHPSTYTDQVWVWMPKDRLGFSEIIIEDLKRAGVEASDLGATMDEKGTVEVNRNPPDEEWTGGHDR